MAAGMAHPAELQTVPCLEAAPAARGQSGSAGRAPSPLGIRDSQAAQERGPPWGGRVSRPAGSGVPGAAPGPHGPQALAGLPSPSRRSFLYKRGLIRGLRRGNKEIIFRYF